MTDKDLIKDEDVTLSELEELEDLEFIEEEDTIIEALDRIQMRAKNSTLSPKFWLDTAKDCQFLHEKFGFNENQIVLLAVMAEIGEPVSWRGLGKFFGVSRLKAMSFTPDMNALRRSRWVVSSVAREMGSSYVGFKLAYGVISALRNNIIFTPESIENLPEQIFVNRIVSYIYDDGSDSLLPFEEKRDRLMDYVNANRDLPLCKRVLSYSDDLTRITILLMIADYIRCRGDETSGLGLFEFGNWFESEPEFQFFSAQLRDGAHRLFLDKILDFDNANGMIDTDRYVLTPAAIEELLPKYKFRRKRGECSIETADLIKPESISEKTLFYNPTEKESIIHLTDLLSQEALTEVQSRLTEKGMRPGITCLFYGAPGTGKTETALQLARITGRQIMQVDISSMRDKYVGESEKNVKGLFDRYKELCKSSDVMPILLFNEADAVIGHRFESMRSSVEKMDNAMQNIILQELEDFQGILIATTNLTGNLDKAFDRRFLFKVEFMRPSVDAKTSIWHSMLPEIDLKEATILAEEFDFSGGQIENIVRKVHIDYALSGNRPTLSRLQQFCSEEALNRSTRSKIGF